MRGAAYGYGYDVGHPGLGQGDDSSWLEDAAHFAVNVVVDLFGGGEEKPRPWGPSYVHTPRRCTGQESYEAALATVQRMSYSQKYQLVQYLKAANGGAGPSVSELAIPGAIPFWTQACHGGVDCIVSSPSGQRLRDYWVSMVQQYGQGYPSTTNGTDYVPGTNVPLPDVQVTWPGWPPGPTSPPAPGPGAPATAGLGMLIPLAAVAALLIFSK